MKNFLKLAVVLFAGTGMTIFVTTVSGQQAIACEKGSACDQSLLSPNTPKQQGGGNPSQGGGCVGGNCNPTVPTPPLPGQVGTSTTNNTQQTSNNNTVPIVNTGGSSLYFNGGTDSNVSTLGDCKFGNPNLTVMATYQQSTGNDWGSNPGAAGVAVAYSTPVGNTGKDLCQRTYALKTTTARVKWCQENGSKAPVGGWMRKHFPDLSNEEGQQIADLCNDFVVVQQEPRVIVQQQPPVKPTTVFIVPKATGTVKPITRF